MRSRPVAVKFVAHNREAAGMITYNVQDLPAAEQERIAGLFRKVKPKEQRHGRFGKK